MKLPASICAGSFIGLMLIVLLTEPARNIAIVALFFIFLLTFLISLGLTLAALRFGTLTPRWRFRSILISLFLVLILMFRSSQSLSWVDGLILLLTIGGIIFYADRRFY